MMQESSQDQPMGFPSVQCVNAQRLLLRVAGAGVAALLMAAVFGQAAFAKSVPVKHDELPVAVAPQQRAQQEATQQEAPQQENVAVDAHAGIVIVAVDEAGPAAQAGIVRGDILRAAVLSSLSAQFQPRKLDCVLPRTPPCKRAYRKHGENVVQ